MTPIELRVAIDIMTDKMYDSMGMASEVTPFPIHEQKIETRWGAAFSERFGKMLLWTGRKFIHYARKNEVFVAQ